MIDVQLEQGEVSWDMGAESFNGSNSTGNMFAPVIALGSGHMNVALAERDELPDSYSGSLNRIVRAETISIPTLRADLYAA